ncbi:MAG: hypothetical protein ABMA64_10070 [Myxococcota bacterium]
MGLAEVVADAAGRQAVVASCVRLVEEQVDSKRGLSGAALKAGYAAFKRVRPGMVAFAVDKLLPEFAAAIDPHWAQGVAAGDPDGWFRSHQRPIAQDLLAVTDRIAGRSHNRVLVKLYQSLRGSAVDHVAEAVPRLAPLIRTHTAAR